MTNTVRVSFDVPEEEHTLVKSDCAKNRIALRSLLKDIFHKTAEEVKKKQLHDMINRGFQDVYEGKTTRLTDEILQKWEEMLSDE